MSTEDANNCLKSIAQYAFNEKKSTAVLTLYVYGLLPNSFRAIKNICEICRNDLDGNLDVKIIDISRRQGLLSADSLFVIPALVLKFPLPERRLFGDFSNKEKVLQFIKEKNSKCEIVLTSN